KKRGEVAWLRDRKRRQDFLRFPGLPAITSSSPARAQKDMSVVSGVVPRTAKLENDRIAEIRKGMQQARLIEGVDYAFALRFADGVFDRLPGLALELAALKPRVIVASAAAVTAVHKVAPDLPLVFSSVAADPIKLGLAQSYV